MIDDFFFTELNYCLCGHNILLYLISNVCVKNNTVAIIILKDSYLSSSPCATGINNYM